MQNLENRAIMPRKVKNLAFTRGGLPQGRITSPGTGLRRKPFVLIFRTKIFGKFGRVILLGEGVLTLRSKSVSRV